ncbi:nuclear transport factor 2 family protein [Flavilitoribacter nigricans]|uniref:SnoaL-like domain-containing protein n=1 Tax=Flavilitoribacter nigricans (strain ATCC 23147 / DSM 23189 / NBRC 102662 / NCIMB 1420 / SS-2) TaxID=1122177 RepID=A0A2D0MX46_FLAN2|nr:nuclear transport factor 2 family protein [Flavilitoribacter nigricans]PHN00750.1 hypothetical protein CRP01_40535 [Flavilitoribacter nigricans DSM 23189 = NBRC 102662]
MKKSALQVYQDFYAAMLSKTDAWQSMITDDVKLVGPLAQVEGKEAFIAANTPFFASIVSVEQLRVLKIGNTVVTQIHVKVGMPNGATVSLDVSEWYDISGGKIASLRTYFDTFDFRNAFG